MTEVKDARAAWWARNPHLQTTLGRIARSRNLVALRREVLTTPDDDDLVLDHVDGPAGAPRVLLLHGLEGSSHSVYMQGLARLVARAGWQATAINFRTCARDPANPSRSLPNRQPRLYHSGDTADLDFVVRTLAKREPSGTLYAVGVSLGGNVLLKWLGEQGARSRIEAAATISVPYDLRVAARHLEKGAGRFYAGTFLKTLRAKALVLR
jgi:predicted alpha/beta-fold hydrolase